MHSYIYSHSQILTDVIPGDEVQAISILKSQCANMTFANQIINNRMFQQVGHKGEDTEINYSKIFHNDKALATLVGNSYTEDQHMHTFLDNF